MLLSLLLGNVYEGADDDDDEEGEEEEDEMDDNVGVQNLP